MIKCEEIDDVGSCFNKAGDRERLFILLSRDPAAPVAIRAWIAERIRLGKNVPGDWQIREAFECAALMELERSEIEARRQEIIRWAESGDAPKTFSISKFASTKTLRTVCESVTWAAFSTIFSEPRRAACTLESCLRKDCPHKQGPCWSPALFAGAQRTTVEAISQLVFDVDQTSDDGLDEIRDRLGKYQFLMHGTHSDRPSSRSVRIIVALSRSVLPNEWPKFWDIVRRTYVPSADASCADAARMYFLPSCPKDAGYFSQVNAGTAMNVDAVLAIVAQVDDRPAPIADSGACL